ncbi:MAG: hypothetical protein JNM17_18890 [Archangium sp.]|nr:hypothetical protein [Archangium sp.]
MTQREWTIVEVQQAVSDRSPQLAEALEWFWRNGTFSERHGDFISIARDYWAKREDVREVLLRLRPPLPKRVTIDSTERWDGLMDWLALNDALGLQEESLAWFDARVALSDFPLPSMNRLMRLLLERGHIADFGAFADAADTALDHVELTQEEREELQGLPPDLIEEQLAQTDTEIAFWRLVAQTTNPERVDEIDAAIATCPRAAEIRALIELPNAVLISRMIANVTY